MKMTKKEIDKFYKDQLQELQNIQKKLEKMKKESDRDWAKLNKKKHKKIGS